MTARALAFWRWRIRWRWVALAALALVLLVAVPRLPVARWLADLQTFIAGLGAAGVLLLSAVYLAFAVLLGPCWLITITAGLTYGLARGVALISLVSTIGAALAFGIGRYLARARVEDFTRRNRTFAAIDRAIGKNGWKIVFLLRLSAVVPYTVSNYVYGASAIRFWPYLFASWAGMLPLTALYVSIGAAGRAALGTGAAHRGALAAGVVVTILVTFYVARISRRELARESAAAALPNSEFPKGAGG